MNNSKKNTVITIDGPAGAGKSTVSRNLAKKLGFIHLNSGALFRSVGLIAQQRGVSLADDAAVTAVARSLQFSFELNPSGQTYFVCRSREGDGSELNPDITSEKAGEIASQVGLLPQLREVLLQEQRNVATKKPVVAEGRDAGTVVFPDASAKFYLVAEAEVRAKRRLAELLDRPQLNSGKVLTLEAVMREMFTRDERDSKRKIAPQKQAEDAILVDTSPLTVEQVVEKLVSILRERGVLSAL